MDYTPYCDRFSCARLLALAAQIQANRRLRNSSIVSENLLRITHELKTPIAGIRIMAENLETGVYLCGSALKPLARLSLKQTR